MFEEAKRGEDVIRDGEDVLLFLDLRWSYLIRVRKGQTFHTHKGFIPLDDIVGKRFGDRVKTSLGVEFVILRPTIHDHVRKMAHATQIIYPKDLSLIIAYAGIGPGDRVVEAGTGSGALTSALAHYVRPSGHVYSYEVRPEFLDKARKNIDRAGLLEYVELKNVDATTGFDERNVDAVILDLATPWLVVPRACEALRGSGAFVSFSPTIEQTVKTVEALEASGFVGEETTECILRRIKVKRGETRPETLMIGHTGYLTYARKAFV